MIQAIGAPGSLARIVLRSTRQEEIDANTKNGEVVVPLFTDAMPDVALFITAQGDAVEYATAPTISQDKISISADGLEEITFTGIPSDADVRVAWPNGDTDSVQHDGTLEISTELIGTHTLAVRGLKYIEQIFTFEAI